MGFQKTVEVPEGEKIGFASVEKNGIELMYQSFASVDKDNAATGAAVRKGPSFLYIEVANLDAALAATEGAEIVMPVRATFYQSKEFGIKDPVGHYLIFAQQGAASEADCGSRSIGEGSEERIEISRLLCVYYWAALGCYICE